MPKECFGPLYTLEVSSTVEAILQHVQAAFTEDMNSKLMAARTDEEI